MPTSADDEQTRCACTACSSRLRHFEKRAYDLFLQNLIKGTSHLSLGQEAIAAAFGVAMRRGDTRSAPIAATSTRSRAALPMAAPCWAS